MLVFERCRCLSTHAGLRIFAYLKALSIQLLVSYKVTH